MQDIEYVSDLLVGGYRENLSAFFPMGFYQQNALVFDWCNILSLMLLSMVDGF